MSLVDDRRGFLWGFVTPEPSDPFPAVGRRARPDQQENDTAVRCTIRRRNLVGRVAFQTERGVEGLDVG
jgi:hypothetical protein